MSGAPGPQEADAARAAHRDGPRRGEGERVERAGVRSVGYGTAFRAALNCLQLNEKARSSAPSRPRARHAIASLSSGSSLGCSARHNCQRSCANAASASDSVAAFCACCFRASASVSASTAACRLSASARSSRSSSSVLAIGACGPAARRRAGATVTIWYRVAPPARPQVSTNGHAAATTTCVSSRPSRPSPHSARRRRASAPTWRCSRRSWLTRRPASTAPPTRRFPRRASRRRRGCRGSTRSRSSASARRDAAAAGRRRRHRRRAVATTALGGTGRGGRPGERRRRRGPAAPRLAPGAAGAGARARARRPLVPRRRRVGARRLAVVGAAGGRRGAWRVPRAAGRRRAVRRPGRARGLPVRRRRRGARPRPADGRRRAAELRPAERVAARLVADRRGRCRANGNRTSATRRACSCSTRAASARARAAPRAGGVAFGGGGYGTLYASGGDGVYVKANIAGAAVLSDALLKQLEKLDNAGATAGVVVWCQRTLRSAARGRGRRCRRSRRPAADEAEAVGEQRQGVHALCDARTCSTAHR